MGEFVKVAQVADVAPGHGRLVEVAGRLIALFNCAGTFYALDDTCTHAEASLAEGYLEGRAVECPLHGSQFDITTGEAVSLPATGNAGKYDVKVVDGEILVSARPVVPYHE